MTETPRRTVMKAAAWSVPVIALAVPAPTFAASPSQNASISFEIRQYIGSSTENSYGQERYYTTTYGATYNSDTQNSATYIRFSGTTTDTTISNISYELFLPVSGATFTTQNNNSCWSAPVRDTSLTIRHTNGTLLYGYRSRYNCAITPVNGTTILSDFEWASNYVTTNNATENYWARKFIYTLNGVPITFTDTGGAMG